MTQNDKDFIEKIRAGKINASHVADFIEAQYRIIDLLEDTLSALRNARNILPESAAMEHIKSLHKEIAA